MTFALVGGRVPFGPDPLSFNLGFPIGIRTHAPGPYFSSGQSEVGLGGTIAVC